jgi:hypothetical protein
LILAPPSVFRFSFFPATELFFSWLPLIRVTA